MYIQKPDFSIKLDTVYLTSLSLTSFKYDIIYTRQKGTANLQLKSPFLLLKYTAQVQDYYVLVEKADWDRALQPTQQITKKYVKASTNYQTSIPCLV